MQKVLITGGAGFIGSNLAKYHMDKGDKVIVFDNLSRRGVKHNIDWLKENGKFEFILGDIRNREELEKTFRDNTDISLIYHQAAQVAVTHSIKDPRTDFEINALGTFNVLEAMRQYTPDAILIYSSTNKVYGDLANIDVAEEAKRYAWSDAKYRNGISEERNLDFHSPYGCSKGAADQLALDYSRIYGLKTVVFRQSCIYGFRQMGHEDQGWVAWFAIQSLLGKPLTLYGTGKQVRDILFIDDLIAAYQGAIKNIKTAKGKAYNMGGGVRNALSLLELLDLLGELGGGKKIEYALADWRDGDQKVFIADTARAEKELGWSPKVDKRTGITMLHKWLSDHRHHFA